MSEETKPPAEAKPESDWEVVGVYHKHPGWCVPEGRSLSMADLSEPPDDRGGWKPLIVQEDDEGRPTVYWQRHVRGWEPYRCGHGYEGFCPYCIRDAMQGQLR